MYFISQEASFQCGNVKFTKYMDSFPFPFYVLLKDIEALPRTLADLLRQVSFWNDNIGVLLFFSTFLYVFSVQYFLVLIFEFVLFDCVLVACTFWVGVGSLTEYD